jgi:hypothetical protein
MGQGKFGAMARLPRMVLPGIPHHVTQRGNRNYAELRCAELNYGDRCDNP